MTSPLDQKLKVSGPVVVTANRLGDGAVVYRTPEGRWTTEFARAAIATTAATATEMLRGANADGLSAVGAYVAPVKRSPNGNLLPGNLRETIRLNGPTITLPSP